MFAVNASSPWSPWRHQAFRAIWTAGLVSNIGNWMQNVGAAWMMTSLTEAVIMVALIQTASALPSFLLALPAGAAADIVDRRRLMLCAQSVMLVVSAALSIATLTGQMTPWLLLGLTFALGCGNAFSMPAQQATTSDVVPQDEVPRAVVLSGISFNSARAIGPLAAGVLIAWAGSGVVFVANILSFSLVICLLWRWKNPRRDDSLPRERLYSGIVAGVWYVWHSPVMHGLMLRSLIFVCGSSALWALLPVVARNQLGLDAAGYGVLLGSLGAGSVLAAGAMPWVRRNLGLNQMLTWSTIAFAGAGGVVAYVPVMWLDCIALLLAGMAWITINATISAAVHTSVAHWVRGRALAIHLLCFQGSMAAGAVIWGGLATYCGTSFALGVSGACLLLGLVLMRQRPLVMGDGPDLQLLPNSSQDATGIELPRGDGLVFVRVRYCTRSVDLADFMVALHALGGGRLRNGARRWRVRIRHGDMVSVVETYFIKSWGEWLRYRDRRTLGDKKLEAAVQELQINPHLVPEATVRVARVPCGSRTFSIRKDH